MVRIIAYTCLVTSGALAGVYGYTTGNTELMGLLRALGWAAVAFVGGCCPAWFFAHLDDKAYGRAAFTALVGLVCAGVTLNGSIGGITGTGDKYAAERSRALDNAKSDRATLARITREREAMVFTPANNEGVEAARSAVAAAERNRIAECGANNERRGNRCREREADEQATRDVLSGALASKAATDRAAVLDADAAAIRARLERAQAVQSVNPGAAAVSRLLRIEVDDAVSWSALLGALALELAGMAAMLRADSRTPPASTGDAAKAVPEVAQAGASPSTASKAEGRVKRPPVIAGVPLVEPPKPATPAGVDTVGRFMLACLRKAPSREAAGGAIYARYRRWCAEQQPAHSPLEPKAFAQHFAERCERVGIKTRRDGGKVYCVGVELVA